MLQVLTPEEAARHKLREAKRHFQTDTDTLAREKVLRVALHELIGHIRKSGAKSTDPHYTPEFIQNCADNAAGVLAVINEPIEAKDERE